jgi:hypothetical protein
VARIKKEHAIRDMVSAVYHRNGVPIPTDALSRIASDNMDHALDAAEPYILQRIADAERAARTAALREAYNAIYAKYDSRRSDLSKTMNLICLNAIQELIKSGE